MRKEKITGIFYFIVVIFGILWNLYCYINDVPHDGLFRFINAWGMIIIASSFLSLYMILSGIFFLILKLLSVLCEPVATQIMSWINQALTYLEQVL